MVGLNTAVHIVFWTTGIFAVLERSEPAGDVGSWDPDQLRENDQAREVSLVETVGSLVFLVLIALALVWQHVNSPVRDAGQDVPVLDPALWSLWIPLLLAVVAGHALVVVLAYRARRWTMPLALVGVALDVVAAGAVVYLLQTGQLFNGAFLDVISAGGWVDAERDLTLGLTIGVVGITLWDQVETFRRVRATKTAQAKRAPTTSRKRAVCRSTSAGVMYGHISAMLWKGVMRMPRVISARCRYASRSSSCAAADSSPLRGAGRAKRYSARAPSQGDRPRDVEFLVEGGLHPLGVRRGEFGHVGEGLRRQDLPRGWPASPRTSARSRPGCRPHPPRR